MSVSPIMSKGAMATAAALYTIKPPAPKAPPTPPLPPRAVTSADGNDNGHLDIRA